MPAALKLEDRVFGRLTVVRRVASRKQRNDGHSYWICKCTCGKVVTVDSRALRKENGITSCGCDRQLIEIGRTFKWLTVEKVLRENKRIDARIYYRCRCVCGKKITVSQSDFLLRLRVSCGCRRWERIHGAAREGKNWPEYRIWASMKARCSNPRNRGWMDYGGRGITVCVEWIHDFRQFIIDVGRRPSAAYSLERRDNDLGYSKDNCYWATRDVQAKNKRPHTIKTPVDWWLQHSGMMVGRMGIIPVPSMLKAGFAPAGLAAVQ